MRSAPRVRRKAPSGHMMKVANAAPCVFRQREQWQCDMNSSGAVVSQASSPHRQLPRTVSMETGYARGRSPVNPVVSTTKDPTSPNAVAAGGAGSSEMPDGDGEGLRRLAAGGGSGGGERRPVEA